MVGNVGYIPRWIYSRSNTDNVEAFWVEEDTVGLFPVDDCVEDLFGRVLKLSQSKGVILWIIPVERGNIVDCPCRGQTLLTIFQVVSNVSKRISI